jgi:hypothetical protein
MAFIRSIVPHIKESITVRELLQGPIPLTALTG